MRTDILLTTRRQFLAGAAAAGAFGLIPSALRAETGDAAIRPFRINIPNDDIIDLRRRLTNTRWPDDETVFDDAQGVQANTLRSLLRAWSTDYDWRKVEAQLNALPMFITRIDDLDIQFIHVRSRHADAMPMIMTHGWPGSILEFLKVIEPLAGSNILRRRG